MMSRWWRDRRERGADVADPPPSGIWARQIATSTEIQRRTAELAGDAGEVGALLTAGVEAGRAVHAAVSRLGFAGSRAWPDDALRVPAAPEGRRVYEQVRRLVSRQRAVLHRATLLSMPADAREQAVLIAGLKRAVGELVEAAAASAAPGDPGPAPSGPETGTLSASRRGRRPRSARR